MNVTLTRQPRTAAPPAPVADPEPARVVWVDPAALVAFTVHDAGVSGRSYPELVRDGAEQRAAINRRLISDLASRGWDHNEPAVLHVDRSTGLARLRDGNHRTHFAVATGLPRVPLRIIPARVPSRGTTIAYPYGGEFDHADFVL